MARINDNADNLINTEAEQRLLKDADLGDSN